jgi:hypothetical protein
MLKQRKQQENRSCNSITCECDSLGEEREEYAEEHEYEGKHHDRTKLLITFAIAMTVSIILLEAFPNEWKMTLLGFSTITSQPNGYNSLNPSFGFR